MSTDTEKPLLERKKILYILNTAKRVNNFSYTSMIAAQKMGLEFHIAGNWSYIDEERSNDEKKYGIKIHQIDFIRTPYHPKNLKAYNQLKKLVKKEKYDYIHCNTPIGGVLGRLVGKRYKTNNVIYQAHGFHFYNGAPKKNWMLYYTVEKWFSRYTDALITINREDFEIAQKKLNLRNHGKVYYVPGVGIDVSLYQSNRDGKSIKREELKIPNNAFVLISAGELNENKNNNVIISALEKLKCADVHYILCGVGELEESLRKQAEDAGLTENVHFLGYRSDVKELYQASDCFVMPSLREGLSRSIMEAMASGLPCIVSKIRGNVDLVEQNLGGYLCSPTDVEAFAEAIKNLVDNVPLRENMSRFNLEKIKEFDISIVIDEMEKIYKETFM